MSIKANFKRVLVKLSQDPALKVAMAELQARKAAGSAQGESLVRGMLSAALLTGRFVGKRRARAVADFLDVAVFLISLSLIVKQNLFDRPEVRAFFAKTWSEGRTGIGKLNMAARKHVATRLARISHRFA